MVETGEDDIIEWKKQIERNDMEVQTTNHHLIDNHT